MDICLYTNNDYVKTMINAALVSEFKDARLHYASGPVSLERCIRVNSCELVFIDADTAGSSVVSLAYSVMQSNPGAHVVMLAEDGVCALDTYRIDSIEECMQGMGHGDCCVIEIRSGNPDGSVSIKKSNRSEVYLDGKPVNFPRNKSKELLGFLAKHNGTMVTDTEMISCLWGTATESRKSYLRNLKSEIVKLFSDAGCSNAIIKCRGQMGIMADK